MTELCKLAEKYYVDKCPKYNHYYTPEYHKLLNEKKYSSMLEIGIGYPELMKKFTCNNYKSGASLFMWRDYFKDCIIHGADIKNFTINEENIVIHQCDQSNCESLETMMNTIGIMDFIIDDGSHILEHQILTFQTLNKYCNDMYIIEDIQPENIEKICSLNDGSWICHSYKHGKDNQGFVAFQKCTNTPKIFYINLDKRTDKRCSMETMLDGYDYERISAIEDKRGYIGCVKSHILCLQLAKSRRYKSVIILEDDFMFMSEMNFKNMKIPSYNFDMLLLSNLIKSSENYDKDFKRVFKAEWTSGYFINENFYDSLISVFKESLEALMIKYCRENYLDVYWEKIFKDSMILSHNKTFGGQISGYSDIQNKNVNRSN
jgi:hypothetical protein